MREYEGIYLERYLKLIFKKTKTTIYLSSHTIEKPSKYFLKNIPNKMYSDEILIILML